MLKEKGVVATKGKVTWDFSNLEETEFESGL